MPRFGGSLKPTSSRSKTNVFPARGGFASITAEPSSLIFVTVAGNCWPPPPSITCVPTARPAGTRPASTVISIASFLSPYAFSGGNVTLTFSPTRRPKIASSKPGTTSPAPSLSSRGGLPSDESNMVPSGNVPRYRTKTSSPFDATLPCPSVPVAAMAMPRRPPFRRGSASTVPAAATAATTRRPQRGTGATTAAEAVLRLPSRTLRATVAVDPATWRPTNAARIMPSPQNAVGELIERASKVAVLVLGPGT
mmetsp:Transcript_18177/g.39805  ORF Transcript_18177/g.39805 Transcript_18177/m.39805 type:complete len:252 (+) Transcript_18177:856-1611(+)